MAPKRVKSAPKKACISSPVGVSMAGKKNPHSLDPSIIRFFSDFFVCLESGSQKPRPAFTSIAPLIISQITSIRFEGGEKHLAAGFCYAAAVWHAHICDKLRWRNEHGSTTCKNDEWGIIRIRAWPFPSWHIFFGDTFTCQRAPYWNAITGIISEQRGTAV